MTSNKPYLIRAFHEWITDNQLTPYLLVDARYPGVSVPDTAIDEQGRVVFNLSWQAVHGLEMGNETIAFDARFSGVSYPVRVPVAAVMAIYARENGAGTMFEVEPPPKQEKQEQEVQGKTTRAKTALRLVKD